MLEVEGNVVSVLGDRNDRPPKRMRDPRFIKHVRVLVGEVADDDVRSIDQRKNILNDLVLFPNVVSSLAVHSGSGCRFLNGRINRVEACTERHHNRYKPAIPWLRRNAEHRRSSFNFGWFLAGADAFYLILDGS